MLLKTHMYTLVSAYNHSVRYFSILSIYLLLPRKLLYFLMTSRCFAIVFDIIPNLLFEYHIIPLSPT